VAHHIGGAAEYSSMATISKSLSASTARPLAIAAKRSYLQFLWGTSFGVLVVLATPLVTLAALTVAVAKNTHDTLMHMLQS
jgi:predicted alpha/beta superfamily hydrolase